MCLNGVRVPASQWPAVDSALRWQGEAHDTGLPTAQQCTEGVAVVE